MRILGNVINVSRPDLECALNVLDSRSVERRELACSELTYDDYLQSGSHNANPGLKFNPLFFSSCISA